MSADEAIDADTEEATLDEITEAIQATAQLVAAKANALGVGLNAQTLLTTHLEILTEMVLGIDGEDVGEDERARAHAWLQLMIQRRVMERLEEVESQQRQAELLAGTGAGGGLVVPEGFAKPSRQVRRAEARKLGKKIVDGGFDG